MKIVSLIRDLKNSGVNVSLSGNDLRVDYTGEELAGDSLDIIKKNKQDIISFLRQMNAGEMPEIPAIPSHPDYPVSSSQHRLWILSQFEEATVAYNLPGTYVFEGNLSLEALAYAFDTLIERHESLRTVFRENEKGELRQLIRPSKDAGFRMGYFDIRKEEQVTEKLKQLIEADLFSPFDLAQGPLLRVNLYQLPGNKWIFTYVMHHIISDGWSMNILIRELLLLYNAYSKGDPNPLPPLRIQYKDYAAWEQQQLSHESLPDHKNYWLKQFEGELQALDLPGDRPRPAIKTYNGGVVHRKIGRDASLHLKTIIQEEGATLFMGLLAIVKTLMFRYTGQQDIVIGSPIAGREHIDLENQIGFYVNTLALRTRFSADDNFRQLLQNIKQVTLGAYKHHIYPFGELVNELQLPPDMSRNALFDVMIVLQNTAINRRQTNEQELDDLRITEYAARDHAVSKFDLTFNFSEVGDEILVNIEYNSDIYDRKTADHLANHLVQLTEAIVAEPMLPLDSIDFLHDWEKEQLSGFNNTYMDFGDGATVIDLFEEMVNKTPGNTALVFENRTLTYATLNERSNQLARYLKIKYGVGPHHLVGVRLARTEWMIISILAILKAGATYVPVDMAYPQERINYIIADSNCSLTIDEQELNAFREIQHGFNGSNLPGAILEDGLAYVIYTSGSTGDPKGVMISHANVYSFICWCRNEFSDAAADVVFAVTSICFDLSVFEIFYTLCTGKKLRLLENALSIPDYLHTGENILLNTVPGVVGSLLNDNVDLSSVKVLNMAGEPIPEKYVAALDYKRMAVRNLYGPSEATTYSTVYRIKDNNRISIGRPIANTIIYILNQRGRLQPVGITGEICIAGAGLAKGYLNRPGLTAEKFLDDPFRPGEKMYKSGDLGRWLPDGNIQFIGRKDNQVKIRGYRIEPGEIETALEKHRAIDSAVVIAWPARDGEKELVAYIVSKEPLNISGIREFLSETLPAYMIPGQFVSLDALPFTPNGKIDRKRLPAPSGHGLAVSAEYIAPQNEIEQKLVFIWQQVLGRDKVGVTDNFFDLGGNSFRLIKMSGMVNRIFGKKIAIVLAFRLPTIKALAEYIRLSEIKNETVNTDRDAKDAVEIMDETFKLLNESVNT